MNSSVINPERKVAFRMYDRKTILIAIILIIVTLSLPINVKCDTGDTISSLILFMVISIALFAGIGWWRKRGEMK